MYTRERKNTPSAGHDRTEYFIVLHIADVLQLMFMGGIEEKR